MHDRLREHFLGYLTQDGYRDANLALFMAASGKCSWTYVDLEDIMIKFDAAVETWKAEDCPI